MKNLNQVFNIKKTFLLIAFIELLSFSLSANPGDTTWVTIYNNRKLTYYGNYDTVASLPTGLRFRKIRMHYIIGRYACPGSAQYCGSWDYTTQIHARPAGMDTVEIARVITPYASDWLASNKKHDYIIEVTDYAKALEGSTAIRFKYDGYSWGFTITLKLEMIEGIPPMDAISVKKVYDGYFQYGNNANSIENYLVAKTFSYTAPVAKAFIKNTVSGHGADATGCGEFCSKYYRLKIDNNMISQKQLWRADCGVNNVYPQTGTWVFERGNWCPGAVVWPIYHDLSSVTSANTTYSVDVDMQAYSIASGWGGYNFVSQVINYSQPNHALDISIEDIIAPTKDANYLRKNPTCTNPIIKIKNTGTAQVTSAVFSYGIAGGSPVTFTWTGALNFLEETEVVFQPLVPVLTQTADAAFNVSVVSVNGSTGDGNLFNNIYQSTAAPVTIYPDTFVVRIMTNKSTDPATSKNETSWTIYDEYDNVVTSRTGLTNNTLYTDTVGLTPGCYRFKIEDAGCDGFAWWYYANYSPNPGNGTLLFKSAKTASVTHATFNGDFGCEQTKYFKVLAPPSTVGIKSYLSDNSIDVYPNPAQNIVYIRFDLNRNQDLTYKITDVNGRLVQQKTLDKMSAGYESVDVSLLNNGIYFVSVQLAEGPAINKKVVIQR